MKDERKERPDRKKKPKKRSGTTRFFEIRADWGNKLEVLWEGQKISYNVEGWIEINEPRSKGKKPRQELIFPVIRLVGTRCSNSGSAPRKIALRPLVNKPPAFPITADEPVKTFEGESALEVEVPDYSMPSLSHQEECFPVSTAKCFFSIQLSEQLLIFKGKGYVELIGVDGFISFPIEFACLCPPVPKPCLELCIHVKVADDDGVPTAPMDEVKEMITEANKVFGCSPPGQCCIRFRLGGLVAAILPQIPLTVESTANDADSPADRKDPLSVTALHRSKDCYNVYVIDSVRNAGGVTVSGTEDRNGSIVDNDSVGGTQRARVLTHELAHALGLRGSRTGTEQNGVDDHSPDTDNLMSGGIAQGTELNYLQCERMRSSSLLVQTTDTCVWRARGPVWF